MRNLKIISFFALIIMACQGSSDFKKINDFKNSEWLLANQQVFEFDIKDVSKTYGFHYLIRNSVSYPYFNIYINQQLESSDSTILVKTMDELVLFDQKSGKPKGDGLGDIFDNKFKAPTLQKFRFPKPGKYKWKISHNMRPDPLPGVMSVGAIVEADK
ncbi:MAG: gliding motility lipoprotein GldH [Cytophagaceae bacterium]|nr:gliding motility lipoprotein GldH [Cytophagaceae bacterium]MBK9511962.1 gliding motility lipoprotein GldH [Cytophagaceae bacterium]MBK9934907.1 gliding motility lipoprotein GldH [Cytophagaceae bacterium]MBL0301345.1 gliding motility lipoprotein GldH [Cytophagaceae bacterium]MBL0324164.1 gliding motility lipoprotein GldH [Cytophagaceae bacterium]